MDRVDKMGNLDKVELAVVGGGPAGLAAAYKAAELGLEKVVLFERDNFLGGQLVKQTHQFFGSKDQYAGTRGVDIAKELTEKVKQQAGIEVKTGAVVQGYYEDGVIGYLEAERFQKVKPEKTIIATGAAEKMLSFPNNDLPGIYGAGAVQTLMNQYGILPGEEILMIGAGNIGLIVTYQLLQAGVKVKAVVEASNKIGGYAVHATKIRRAGIPILTKHTIKEARGESKVEEAVICQLDENWNIIDGTEEILEVDTICLAVGLTPKVDLALQAGCQMAYVPQLGGDVPVRNEDLEMTEKNIYIAGDAGGIEEATAAILEGELAAVNAVRAISNDSSNIDAAYAEVSEKLADLRRGPVGEGIRAGLKKARGDENAGRDRYSCQRRYSK
ncbi:MAG: NAD(P)/FAD-dependent oxidoreductase [Halarsenatibacteraceae bacterium]